MNQSLREIFDYGINLESRVITLFGEIDEMLAYRFCTSMKLLESKSHDPVTVYLNSNGGCVFNGYSIMNSIQTSPCEITIIGTGCIFSMASIIIQAAHKRVMQRDATMMLHDGFESAEGDSTTIASWNKHSKQVTKKINKLLSDKTGKPTQYWARKLKSDFVLSAEEALALKLIDEVIG